MDYARFSNPLSPHAGDYLVRALNVKMLTQAEFCKRCGDRHEGFTANQMEAAIKLMTAELERLAEEETGVRLDFGTLTPGARGVIDPVNGTHTVRGDINMNAAAAFHKTAEGYHMNEVQPSQTGPVVLAVEDAASGAVSSGVTPDGIVTVTGHNIKVEGAGAGVFFRAEPGGAETAVAGPLAENMRSKLIFKAPAALAAGTYHLVVKTHYSGGGTPSAALKTAEFPVALAVPPPVTRT